MKRDSFWEAARIYLSIARLLAVCAFQLMIFIPVLVIELALRSTGHDHLADCLEDWWMHL